MAHSTGTGEAAAAKADIASEEDMKAVEAKADEKNSTETGTAAGPEPAPPGSTWGANITSTTLEQLGFARRRMCPPVHLLSSDK